MCDGIDQDAMIMQDEQALINIDAYNNEVIPIREKDSGHWYFNYEKFSFMSFSMTPCISSYCSWLTMPCFNRLCHSASCLMLSPRI